MIKYNLNKDINLLKSKPNIIGEIKYYRYFADSDKTLKKDGRGSS